jgi:prepilin peptidase CpaA
MATEWVPGMLAVVLGIAAATDLAWNRVYNWLTIPAMLLGLGANAYFHHWAGLGFGLLGLAAGGAVFLPAFLWGGMGAGDIKLMAALGAGLGWVFAVNAALYAALAGGVVALLVLAWRGELRTTLGRIGRWLGSRLRPGQAPETLKLGRPLPYAPVIALGAVAAYFLPSLFLIP